MSEPEFSWSLADIPPADEPPPPPAKRPRGFGPRRLPDPQRARRFWLSVVLLIALVAVGAWVFTQVGWRRLRDQITAEAVYEDEQAQAGEVELVLALQATSANAIEVWRARRSGEVALGLATPLPAAHLTPTGAPPVVEAVEALGQDLFEATVVRTYIDSAGRPAAFALPQFYRNLGPGLWERLPPDWTVLQNTTVLSGQRLSATLPVADLPWLSESLLAADQALVRACADWGDVCGPEWRLSIRFTGVLGYLPAPRAPGPGAAAGLGPYPAAFDLANLTPRFRQPLVLLSPHLAGLPHDEAARQALTHALTVHGLSYLAAVASGTPASNTAGALYREALVARAEERLGLVPAPTYSVRDQDYLPPKVLWDTTEGGAQAPGNPPGALSAAELPLRLVTLNFVDAALAGQPPAADGVLLAALRRNADFESWLDLGLGQGGGAQAAADWQAQAMATFNGEDPLNWRQLTGLAYTCNGDTRLIYGGEPRLLPIADAGFGFFGQSGVAVSPDGRYLVHVRDSEGGLPALFALDLERNADLLLAETAEVYPVGWSGAGALVTIERAPGTPPLGDGGLSNYRAWRYDLASGERAQLADDAVLPYFFGAALTWTPDRTGVLLNGYYGRPDAMDLQALSPVLLRVDPPDAGMAQRVPRSGYGGVLSPDGRQVAYTVPISLPNDNVAFAPVEVYGLESGSYRTLLTAEAAGFSAEAELRFLVPIAWSPDGVWLLVMAASDDGTHVLAQPAAGGAPVTLYSDAEANLSFAGATLSADGRYLAYIGFSQTGSGPLYLIDMQARPLDPEGMPTPIALGVAGVAWSPTGRLLAVAGRGGVRVFDPDSGQTRWVTLQACEGVMWHNLQP